MGHLLTVRGTAELLGVHENTIRNWERRGLLEAVRLPGSGYRRFDPAAVERLRREMWKLPPADTSPDLPSPRGENWVTNWDDDEA